MKLKYAYFFIPILIILAVYYVYDMRSQEGVEVFSTIGSIADFDSDAVVVVELKGDGETVRILRDGTESWMIESPLPTPADASSLEGLFEAVTSARIGRSLGSAQKPSLPEYGLEPPAYELNLLGKGGNVLLSFKVGSKNPAGTGHYALAGAGELLLMEPGAIDFTEKGFEEFRSRRPFDFDRNAVTSFEVSTSEVDYAFKLETGSWFLVHPAVFKASESWCDGLLQLLNRVEAEEFVSDTEGTDIGPLEGGILLVDKDDTKHALDFLGLHKRKGVLASSPRLPQPFFTEFRVVDYLDVTLDELKEMRLVMFTQ